MSFRTIVIENRCKLEYSLNYLICRKGNDETKILLDEIKTIIINSTQVSITSCLISETIKKKIKILFTDEKHNPIGEVTPYQNNFYSYRKIKEQINVDVKRSDYLWKYIIIKKIINQSKNLKLLGLDDECKLLISYSDEVYDGDPSNREGHAAKVYFNAIFGKDFNRRKECDINKYLNYGYSIILSSINREIKSLGYLTELGIHHIGESNQYNLSCDLIEPLRPFVDWYILKNEINDDNFSSKLVGMLGHTVVYNDKSVLLDNAIHLYVEDMLNYIMTGNKEKIRFISYEL